MTSLLKVLGILTMVVVLYIVMIRSTPAHALVENHHNLSLRIGTAGILVLGVAPLIISGGIDLSIGSVVGFSAVFFALMLEKGVPFLWVHTSPSFAMGIAWSGAIGPFPAALIVLGIALLIGLFHGVIVTRLSLQPFLVTLCGLFIYRGLARWATWTEGGSSRAVGIGGTTFDLSSLDFLVSKKLHLFPEWLVGSYLHNLLGAYYVFYLFLLVAIFVGVVLHASRYGRYLYAIGANEQAARYAGVATDRYKIAAYMWCSLMAGLAGLLQMLEVKTAAPASAGAWYELYAITGAVLGGCSLRGGEGTIIGIVLGASVLPLLRNVSFFAGVPDDLKFTVLGVALLLGTILDETLKRKAAARL